MGGSSYRLAARCGDPLGSKTEWSLACPGSGIAVDCCSLLTSVLPLEVVVAGSRVGPAGSTPNTVVLGGAAGSELNGTLIGAVALIGGVIFSVHPRLERATKTASSMERDTTGKFTFVMMNSRSLMLSIMARCCEAPNRMHVSMRVGRTLMVQCQSTGGARVGLFSREIGLAPAVRTTRALLRSRTHHSAPKRHALQCTSHLDPDQAGIKLMA